MTDLVEVIRIEARSWIMTKPNRAHKLNQAADRLETLERELGNQPRVRMCLPGEE